MRVFGGGGPDYLQSESRRERYDRTERKQSQLRSGGKRVVRCEVPLRLQSTGVNNSTRGAPAGKGLTAQSLGKHAASVARKPTTSACCRHILIMANDPFYVRYYSGHSGRFGHEFLEFDFRALGDGRSASARYANNSNYRNDSLIRKEMCVSSVLVAEIKRIIKDSEIMKLAWLVTIPRTISDLY